MPFHIELQSTRPVLLSTYGPQFKPVEVQTIAAEQMRQLDLLDHTVYFLADVSTLQFDLGDIMRGVMIGTQGAGAPLHHAAIIETLVVTRDAMLKAAANSMKGYVFGKLSVKVFATLDEALAYVDEQIAAGAAS